MCRSRPPIATPLATRSSPSDELGRLLSLGALIAGCIMLLVAGSLLARHQFAATSQFSNGRSLVAIAVLLMVSATAIRLMILAGQGGKNTTARLAWASPTIAYVLIATAISLPAIRGIGWGVTWAVIVATETAWWIGWISRRSFRDSRAVVVPVHDTGRQPEINQGMNPESSELEQDLQEPAFDDLDAELNELLPAGTNQKISRSQAGEGERLDVLMRLTFPAGQRSQFSHLPIHPALPSEPEVEYHQLAGPACSIKVAESRAFGIRLELRLNQMPTDEVSIVVQVEVVADSDQSAAA